MQNRRAISGYPLLANPSLWLGWCAYALFYFVFVFNYGFLRMDDFSYLRCVAESLGSGRIVTDDWLAPYNAAFTLVGVLTYRLTGNFIFSTWGIHSLFALANFPLLFSLLKRRLSDGTSLLLSLLILTFPVYLHVSGEYSGIIPSLTAFFSALIFWQRENWIGFFLSSAIAMSTRQNNLALLALPGWLVLSEAFLQKKLAVGKLLAILGCLAGMFLLHGYLAPTSFQLRTVHSHVNLHNALSILETFIVGLTSAILFMAFLNILFNGQLRSHIQRNIHSPLAPAFATALLLPILFFRKTNLIYFHTYLPGISNDEWNYLQILFLLAQGIGIWLMDWRLLRLGPIAVLIIAYSFMSSFLGYLWDYYLLLQFFLGLLYVLQYQGPISLGSRVQKAILAVVVFLNVGYAYELKILFDKQKISTDVFEKLERKGLATPENMTGASFGFMSWKLYDHLIQEGNADSLSVKAYINAHGLWVETTLPWRNSFPRKPNSILEEGQGKVGFFPVRYRVIEEKGIDSLSLGGRVKLPFIKSNYHPRPFPLNNSEWRRFIDEEHAEAPFPANSR